MSLATIRTEVRRWTDKVRNFSTADLDLCVNNAYLIAWKELDKVAPHRTRTNEDLALVADQLTAYTLTTAPLAILDIQPPHASRNSRTFIAAVDHMEFRRNENQRVIQYVQQSEQSLIIRPAIDEAMTVQVHYVRRPPTITTSQAPINFSDETLSAGTIGLLFSMLAYPDMLYWLNERDKTGVFYTRLKVDLAVFSKFGNNSDLQGYTTDFPYDEAFRGQWPYGGRPSSP